MSGQGLPPGRGLARADDGHGRIGQQGKIPQAVQQHRGVGQCTQQGRISRLMPLDDGSVQITDGIPLRPGRDPPRARGELGSLAPVHPGIGPSFPAFQRSEGRAEMPEQPAAGTGPQTAAMAQGKTGPVFTPGAVVHIGPAGRQGGGSICHGCTSPFLRMRSAAADVGKRCTTCRNALLAPAVSPCCFNIIPVRNRASAFL